MKNSIRFTSTTILFIIILLFVIGNLFADESSSSYDSSSNQTERLIRSSMRMKPVYNIFGELTFPVFYDFTPQMNPAMLSFLHDFYAKASFLTGPDAQKTYEEFEFPDTHLAFNIESGINITGFGLGFQYFVENEFISYQNEWIERNLYKDKLMDTDENKRGVNTGFNLSASYSPCQYFGFGLSAGLSYIKNNIIFDAPVYIDEYDYSLFDGFLSVNTSLNIVSFPFDFMYIGLSINITKIASFSNRELLKFYDFIALSIPLTFGILVHDFVSVILQYENFTQNMISEIDEIIYDIYYGWTIGRKIIHRVNAGTEIWIKDNLSVRFALNYYIFPVKEYYSYHADMLSYDLGFTYSFDLLTLDFTLIIINNPQSPGDLGMRFNFSIEI